MQYFQGERLSHAVGCAFTACLQRKQKAQALQQQHQKQKDDEATVSIFLFIALISLK